MIFFMILFAIAAIILLISYLCFRMAFYVTPEQKKRPDGYPIPDGDIYDPHRPQMIRWIDENRAMAHENVEIRSFDGLTLRAKFYEYAPGAPIEIMFHGYRGSAERDLCGGVQRAYACGHSALVIGQRGSVDSDGNVITFGILESRDCRAWVDFAIEHFGPDVKLILTGISMGASTVMIAAGYELPKNVVGVLADCGFSSAEDIIKNTIRDMNLPPKISYPFVRLGALIFGHFDPNETSAVKAMEHCRLPIIFFHGKDDDYVPSWMSKACFDKCTSAKKLVMVPGAGHGLSFPVDQEGYIREMKEFASTYWY